MAHIITGTTNLKEFRLICLTFYNVHIPFVSKTFTILSEVWNILVINWKDGDSLFSYFVILCLIVCFFLFGVYFIVPLENFSLIWRRHHYRWRVANFDLCSALMIIEQWGFFNVPHLLWHGASGYYGIVRGPVTLTPIAER